MSRMPFIFLAFLHMSDMALAEINITQDPNNLNVPKSDSTRMSCHWNSENVSQLRVQWRKQISVTGEENGTVLCSVVRTEQSNNSEVRHNKTTCNVANNTALLTIDGVSEDDGGLYVCEVIIEIPRLIKAKGNGTQLNVQNDDNNNNNNDLSKRTFLLGVIAIFPFVALFAYFLWKRKKTKSKKIPQNRRQEHLELNQIHQDAAEAEEDSSSTNSVKWAVSTLYESFDYFAMKNPNDKAAASSTSNLARPETTEAEESSLTATDTCVL